MPGRPCTAPFPGARAQRGGRTPAVRTSRWRAGGGARIVTGMKKRVFAALIWFYTGWYAGAMIADVVGIAPLLGPILGTAVAALIAGDPRGVIWSPRSDRVRARVEAVARS